MVKDDIDYDHLFYFATVELGFTEEQFWDCTPRKLFALIEVYNDRHSDKSKKDEDDVVYL